MPSSTISSFEDLGAEMNKTLEAEDNLVKSVLGKNGGGSINGLGAAGGSGGLGAPGTPGTPGGSGGPNGSGSSGNALKPPISDDSKPIKAGPPPPLADSIFMFKKTFSLDSNGSVDHVTLSPHGKLVAFASEASGAKTINIHDVESQSQLFSLENDPPATKLSFSPDGDRLAVLSVDEKLRIYKLDTLEVHELDARRITTNSLVFSPDGLHLAMAAYHEGKGHIKFWDLSNMANPRCVEIETKQHHIHHLAFSNDSKIIVSSTNVHGPALQMWSTQDGKHHHTIEYEESGHETLQFGSHGIYLYTAQLNKDIISVWDIGTWVKVKQIPIPFQSKSTGISTLSLSADGNSLIVGGTDEHLHIVDILHEDVTHTLKNHTGPLATVTTTPDGKGLLTVTIFPQPTVSSWGVKQLQKGVVDPHALAADGAGLGQDLSGDLGAAEKKIAMLEAKVLALQLELELVNGDAGKGPKDSKMRSFEERLSKLEREFKNFQAPKGQGVSKTIVKIYE